MRPNEHANDSYSLVSKIIKLSIHFEWSRAEQPAEAEKSTITRNCAKQSGIK